LLNKVSNCIIETKETKEKGNTMGTEFVVEEEIKKLPASPGVYIMHDKMDVIIYVGKAILLNNRVRSYFRASTKKTPMIQQMVSLIHRFEYIVTDSELEALVLENNLIKEYTPKYNTLLKDDKTYPYIRVTMDKEYPQLQLCRQMKRDGARYFGPFISGGAVRDTIEFLNKSCLLRSCNQVLPKKGQVGRPCLNYQMHQCMAPCAGKITKEEYAVGVQKALHFLKGDDTSLNKELIQKMQEASENLEYEEALRIRKLLESLKSVMQKQKITGSIDSEKDIIALAIEENDAVVQVFFVRNGKLIGREHYYMKNIEGTTRREILTTFVKQFYSGTPFVPKEIMVQEEIEDVIIIEAWLSDLRGSKVYIKVPMRGSKEKLVDLASENAKLVLARDKERIIAEEKETIGAQKEIATILGMEQIQRMEAYDISNTAGYESVGSMVVFENGKPKKSDYRKFKIRTVTGPDDYASLKEVLTRRFAHGLEERKMSAETKQKAIASFSIFPDLILMDGGKGQIHVAKDVLDELGLSIPVCGMVKDEFHRTRGLLYQGEELPLPTRSEGFKLITRVQDEAHRFAITFHRAIRGKEQIHSILDDIPGVGASRKKTLLRAFGSVAKIQEATLEEVERIPGFSKALANEIILYFAKTKKKEDETSTK